MKEVTQSSQSFQPYESRSFADPQAFQDFYTTFEPKVSSRFMCSIKDEDGEQFIPIYILKRITRPRATRVIGGEWKWHPIEIETYDPIVPSAAQIFANYIRDSKVFDMEIKVLGPVGDTVELWQIEDAEIIEVDFGPMDWCDYPPESKAKLESLNVTHHYRGGNAATIKATIAYKNATLIY